MQTQPEFRLLVVRLGAMGDILHALPAVTALRGAHPGWVIDWVVEPRWRALLAASDSRGRDTAGPSARQPLVDTLHPAATRDWRRRPASRATLLAIRGLRTSLRGGAYDAVLDLQGALRSAVISRMAASGRIIGEAAPRERAARWLFTERVATQGVHVIEQDIELASAVAGDVLAPALPALPVDAEAETWADGFLQGSASGSVVLLNPGAGWGAKRWPIDRYIAVAAELIRDGHRILVNVGPDERELAEALVKRTGSSSTSFSGSLDQLIALTRRVALVIAGDTGPLHLACALGRPVVGIYGPTDPARNGPFGTKFRVLRSPQSRRDHTRRAAPEAGLLTIQPGQVLEAARELLYPDTARNMPDD